MFVEVEFGPSGLLVTFDEQTDPNLVRTALEDLLRNGALRWAGLDGGNVQVWRTADVTAKRRGNSADIVEAARAAQTRFMARERSAYRPTSAHRVRTLGNQIAVRSRRNSRISSSVPAPSGSQGRSAGWCDGVALGR